MTGGVGSISRRERRPCIALTAADHNADCAVVKTEMSEAVVPEAHVDGFNYVPDNDNKDSNDSALESPKLAILTPEQRADLPLSTRETQPSEWLKLVRLAGQPSTTAEFLCTLERDSNPAHTCLAAQLRPIARRVIHGDHASVLRMRRANGSDPDQARSGRVRVQAGLPNA